MNDHSSVYPRYTHETPRGLPKGAYRRYVAYSGALAELTITLDDHPQPDGEYFVMIETNVLWGTLPIEPDEPPLWGVLP
jgi:hypothetical protein